MVFVASKGLLVQINSILKSLKLSGLFVVWDTMTELLVEVISSNTNPAFGIWGGGPYDCRLR